MIGVVYVATGAVCGRRLRGALASLHRHEPAAQVVVVEDGPTGWESRSLKTRPHTLVPRSWDAGVMLDVDVLVERPFLERLEEHLVPGKGVHPPVAMARNAPAGTQGDEMAKSFYRKVLGPEHWDHWAATVPAEWPVWNTGVVAWVQGDEAAEFFSRWHDAWCEWPPGPDQVALARARLRPQTLPRRWNFPLKWVRSRLDLAAAREQWNPYLLHGYGLGARFEERVRGLGLG